jgi:response regulator RpfG family c-di-GMP phosphodiesterase
MNLKILLVDPDEAWLLATKKYLESQMYDVVLVSTGKEAQLAIYNEKDGFFSIIMNYDIKNHSFMQVLKFIRTSYSGVKIITTLNKKERLESGEIDEEKLEKMGVSEILVHPFSETDIKYILDGQQSISELMASVSKNEKESGEEEVSLEDANFTKIKINEFYSTPVVLFDIYLKLNSNKYLKILHSGDSFSKERLDKYKDDKQLEFLYFHNNDRLKYIKYNNFLSKKLLEVENVPIQNKVNIVKNVSEKFIEEIFTVGVKPQVIDQGKQVCDTMYQLIEKEPKLYQILKIYQDLEPSAYSHAFLVTIYASSIIKQFHWKSKTTIDNMSLACMLHDIGKTALPKEYLTLNPRKMSPEQFEQYKQHPELGVKLVEGSRAINNTVKQIILQHHENYDGTGFPHSRKGNNILTLANIVHLVDDFVHLMMEEKIQPIDALKRIITDKNNIKKYNSILIEKFINIFVDPEKILKENALPSNSRIVVSKKNI